MTHHAYLFEAKFLQSYIFATNRLREIVGASELLLELTNLDGLLGETLSALSIRSDISFSRCAGGSFYAFSQNEQAIDSLCKLWPIIVQQHAPGLHFTHGKGAGSSTLEAFTQAQCHLFINVNQQQPELPMGNPFIARTPRTGKLATNKENNRGQKSLTDLSTQRKTKAYQSDKLARRLLKDDSYQFPVNLTPETSQAEDKNFPYTKDTNRIAFIHADGNGMGQLLMQLREKLATHPQFQQIMFEFSQTLEQATKEAAQNAITDTLLAHANNQVLPARPIILGGDDLSILVRADLAIAFTSNYLAAFEKATQQHLSNLWSKHKLTNLPQRLTACAGIVYAKPSQPASQLAHLAESLCAHAKKHAKKTENRIQGEIPSTITFHRITTAHIDDYDSILDTELTTTDGHTLYRHTLESYAVNQHPIMPQLTHLIDLTRFIRHQQAKNSALRTLLGSIGVDTHQAQKDYARWQSLLGDNTKTRFTDILQQLHCHADDLPYSTPHEITDFQHNKDTTGYIRISPIGDAQTLLSENDHLTNHTGDQA